MVDRLESALDVGDDALVHDLLLSSSLHLSEAEVAALLSGPQTVLSSLLLSLFSLITAAEEDAGGDWVLAVQMLAHLCDCRLVSDVVLLRPPELSGGGGGRGAVTVQEVVVALLDRLHPHHAPLTVFRLLERLVTNADALGVPLIPAADALRTARVLLAAVERRRPAKEEEAARVVAVTALLHALLVHDTGIAGVVLAERKPHSTRLLEALVGRLSRNASRRPRLALETAAVLTALVVDTPMASLLFGPESGTQTLALVARMASSSSSSSDDVGRACCLMVDMLRRVEALWALIDAELLAGMDARHAAVLRLLVFVCEHGDDRARRAVSTVVAVGLLVRLCSGEDVVVALLASRLLRHVLSGPAGAEGAAHARLPPEHFCSFIEALAGLLTPEAHGLYMPLFGSEAVGDLEDESLGVSNEEVDDYDDIVAGLTEKLHRGCVVELLTVLEDQLLQNTATDNNNNNSEDDKERENAAGLAAAAVVGLDLDVVSAFAESQLSSHNTAIFFRLMSCLLVLGARSRAIKSYVKILMTDEAAAALLAKAVGDAVTSRDASRALRFVCLVYPSSVRASLCAAVARANQTRGRAAAAAAREAQQHIGQLTRLEGIVQRQRHALTQAEHDRSRALALEQHVREQAVEESRLVGEVRALIERCASAEKDCASAEKDCEALRQQVEGLEMENARIAVLEERLAVLEPLEQRALDAESQLTHLHARVSEAEAEVKRRQDDNSQLELQLAEQVALAEELSGRAALLEHELAQRDAALQQAAADHLASDEEAARVRARLQDELAARDRSLQEAQARVKQLEQQGLDDAGRIAALQHEASARCAVLEEKEKRLAKLEQAIQSLQQL